ncbi:MAG: hypothetical protein ABIJ12_10110, partial [bacterium]
TKLSIEEYCPSWDAHLRRIKKKLDEIPTSDRSTLKSYQAIYDRILSLKDVWRNPTMHAGTKYLEEECLEIFNATKRFMEILCDELF